MRVTVYGLWHLGCVTAACLAQAGHRVIGLDLDSKVVVDLKCGHPPLDEPGLQELIQSGMADETLSFTADAQEALQDAEVLWVAFDSPVDDDDNADVAWVRRQLDAVADHVRPGTIVLISSQVPAGFTSALEQAWHGRGLRFAVSPENLRLGKALDCFRKPERIVVGCRDEETRRRLSELFQHFCDNIVWMSIESAEMTKHAINAFLATSVTFINELARICEAVGADAREVERGLKSEGRIGPGAYLSPGAAFAGGTLARDIQFLNELGRQLEAGTPLLSGVWASNNVHKQWLPTRLAACIAGTPKPVVAVLGLTYKPGTNTLRRSASIELCRWLDEQGVCVKGHDPAIRAIPNDLENVLQLCDSPAAALAGADVAVLATPWPEFKGLAADLFVRHMRQPVVIDQSHYLASALGSDSRIKYEAIGLASKMPTVKGLTSNESRGAVCHHHGG